MGLKKMTTDEIRIALNARKEFLDKNYKWVHQDKRYKTLLNEYGKRVMK